MSNASTTAAFLELIDERTHFAILQNIARHYQITPEEAFAEITDPEAEALCDYITGLERPATRLLMLRHGFKTV